MQIDSRLVYALLGSFITLLLVFIFKLVFLSNELIPTTLLTDEALCETPIEQESYAAADSQHSLSEGTTQRPKQAIPQTQTEPPEKTTTSKKRGESWTT